MASGISIVLINASYASANLIQANATSSTVLGSLSVSARRHVQPRGGIKQREMNPQSTQPQLGLQLVVMLGNGHDR